MNVGKKTLAAATLALLLVGSGCEIIPRRKKTPPPPSIPPTIEKRKIDLPAPQPVPPPAANPEPTTSPTTVTTPPKPKPRRNSRPPKRTVVTPEPETNTPPTPAKPAPDASINASITSADAERQKQQTSNLLGAAENNLSNIHRSLNSDEQSMVSQIRNYIAQSRKAMSDGDLERAYNLANKANLLSTELVKE